ncbi:MAG: lipopolysaccharide biosynthesis protein [Nitrosomonadales bacterium]|nr:lipopolysaccharide biosynthesis protein [Nitrosomonadales bacterium]
MATEYELTLSDYLSIMRRRSPYLVGIFVAGFLISVVVAFTLPPSYRATGTIMVETPPVLEGVVPRAMRNDLDERINIIKQRVMTRDGLLQIINKYTLFKENEGSRTTTELIDTMRSRVAVESFSASDAGTSQQGAPTIAFTISFEDRHPEVALQVTNDLVTLFLDWNVKLRTEGATETTAFFSQESDKLKAEVDRLEEKIGAYKRQNSANLPEQLGLRTTMMSRAENDLYSVEPDIRSGNEELRSLEAELAAARHGMSDDPSETLPALKAEFTKLSAIYTESHPDLRALKRKIEALELGASTVDSRNAAANVTNLAVFKIQAKVDAVNARLESLLQQKNMLQAKIVQNEHAMEMTPKVAQGLEILIRDRDSAQRKFDELRNKKMNAQIAQNLESENKSERFSLLEPPILPEKPFKPNRKKILALGFFLALASAIGVVMLLESIDKRIRGAEALTHVLGSRPLVIIPYLHIEGEKVLGSNLGMREIVAALWSRWKP